MSNRYDKMENYIGSIFNVFQLVNRKAEQQKDKRMKMVALVIFNYVKFMAHEYNVDLKNLVEPESINLIPVFEYVSMNNIELYDFKSINMDDLDVTKKEDLERFVLTHVYYITQGK
jgi:hypothetical protein